MASADPVVLVTGATGFIGGRLVSKLLQDGWKVTTLVRPSSTLPEVVRRTRTVVGDLMDAGALRGAVSGADVVLHLGGINSTHRSREAPDEVFRVNVMGTANMLEASRQAGVRRFVQVSSAHVYGPAKRLPVDEAHPLEPRSPYAASKAAAEHVALSYFRAFGLGAAVLRIFNVYGPGQPPEAVIPSIVDQVAAGRRARVLDAAVRRDFVFVDDVAEAIVKAATTPGAVGEVFNIGSGEEISVAEIVRRTEALAGFVSETAASEPMRVGNDRMVSDISRATQILGWSPRTGIRAGLAATLAAARRSLAGDASTADGRH